MGTHQSDFTWLRMQALSLLILLAPGCILALPQDLGSLLGGFLGSRGGGRSLQDTVRNIINNDLNPCPGELPTSCVCTNGNSFQPSNFLDLNQGNPCGRGARPDTCTCPTGATFRADVVAESVANRYNIPTCGQGVEPYLCQCRDGSTFKPSTDLSSRPCDGRPPNIDSCNCPNGDTINRNNFIAAAVPLIQDILGGK